MGANLDTGLEMHNKISGLVRAAVLAMGGFAVLSGCGVTYHSPKVSERQGELPVSVVELTPKAVAYANASHYTPRALPDVFYAYAGSYGRATGAGALPAAPYLPDESALACPHRVVRFDS
jgi:polysaccharide export outer membrane protein